MDSYEIQNLYLQNPPLQIKLQLQQAYPDIITEKHFSYKKLSEKMLLDINEKFDETIIGQEKVKSRLLAVLYPLLKKERNRKPIVLMLSSSFTIIVLKAPVSKERGQQLHDGTRIAVFPMLQELKTRVHSITKLEFKRPASSDSST